MNSSHFLYLLSKYSPLFTWQLDKNRIRGYKTVKRKPKTFCTLTAVLYGEKKIYLPPEKFITAARLLYLEDEIISDIYLATDIDFSYMAIRKELRQSMLQILCLLPIFSEGKNNVECGN